PRRTRTAGRPLLGQHLRSSVHSTRYWEGEVSVAAFPYLEDHCVNGMVLVPAAAYVEMALEAASEPFGEGLPAGEAVSISKDLILPKDGEQTVQVAVTPGLAGRASFRISSLQAGANGLEDSWTVHATGALRVSSADHVAEGADSQAMPPAGDGSPGSEH